MKYFNKSAPELKCGLETCCEGDRVLFICWLTQRFVTENFFWDLVQTS
jgi:hypothetical protein